MDILRKMFKLEDQVPVTKAETEPPTKDEFRKPQWFEEAETDDELFDDDRKFAFQIFTNPVELQKHFERQMQQIFQALNDVDENGAKLDKNLKEEFLKPGFESHIFKEFEEQKKKFMDTDLDGEIYADQLHSLMQGFESNEVDLPKILPRNDNRKPSSSAAKKKLSDEEIIMGKIHGTYSDGDKLVVKRPPRPRTDSINPMSPTLPRNVTPFGGVFEGTYQGPKMFSQSVVSKTIRKPDGSYETTNVTRDSQGNKTTTTTRTVNGKSETVTTYDNVTGTGTIKSSPPAEAPERQVYSDRNIYLSKEGYAVPRNLW